jgi:hypothetical protein
MVGNHATQTFRGRLHIMSHMHASALPRCMESPPVFIDVSAAAHPHQAKLMAAATLGQFVQ